ncbi:MAG: ROK family protein [Evtepia sp.]
MILSVDLGGTKCIFALYQETQGLTAVKSEQHPTKELSSLSIEIKKFLAHLNEPITKAGIALAGAIKDDSCYLPNPNLTLHFQAVRAELSFIPDIRFYNDAEAMIFGIRQLPKQSLLPVKQGTKSSTGCISLLAPGTGLGESSLRNHTILSGEGGHCDFAPQTQLQWELAMFLQARQDHVCCEQLLSGPGIVNIFDFLKTKYGKPNLSYTPQQISEKALSHTCHLCESTYQLFFELLGAEAGNLALRSNALGGIYLGGGILPKIVPLLQGSSFIDSFLKKGNYRFFMEQIPVYLILDPMSVVIGAAHLANEPTEMFC